MMGARRTRLMKSAPLPLTCLFPFSHTRSSLFPSQSSLSMPKPPSAQRDLHTDTYASPKSFAAMLCKSLFVLLALFSIAFFPSEPPNFFSHGLFARSWELLHLFFIGVTVCYGLFSRRNADTAFESPRRGFDDSLPSHVSRTFHVSPIFEDEYQSVFGSDDKCVYSSCDARRYASASVTGSSFIHQHGVTGYLDSANVSDNSINDLVQVSDPHYSCESRIIASRANYGLDNRGKYGQVVDYKPLGLPVRSLKPKITAGSHSGSSLKSSPTSSSGRSVNSADFGDISPKNLEEKFNESVSLPSQFACLSSTGMIEVRENVGSSATHPSHFRPLSVDEAQFESLGSSSFRSHSPIDHIPVRSHSFESLSSEMEGAEKQKSYRASYPAASPSPSIKTNGGTSLNAFHLRRYTSGSLFQKDLRGRSKEEVMNENAVDGLSCSREMRKPSLKKEDEKPVTHGKASTRGKSVRTIRASQYHLTEVTKLREETIDRTDADPVKSCGETKAADQGKNKIRKAGPADLSLGANKNLDAKSHLPKPIRAEYHKREREECSKSVTVKPREDSDSVADKVEVTSDENADAGLSNNADDACKDAAEIDKKAAEFIARFREQIRLQKLASTRKSRGTSLDGFSSDASSLDL